MSRYNCLSLAGKEKEEAGEPQRSRPGPVAAGDDSYRASGRTPNLYWRSASREQLRSHARYVALPEVEDVVASPWFGSEWSYSFIRQEHALWWALHAGRLTASCLHGALGLRERDASRRLGLPRVASSRGHACSAAARLAEAPMAPAVKDRMRGAEPGGFALLAAAFSHVVAYNAAPSMAAAPAPPQQPSQEATAAAVRLATGKKGKKKAALIAAMPDTPEARKSQSAAQRGLTSVRLAWGTAQEGGTLWAVLAAFPAVTIFDVGLCVPCDASSIIDARPAGKPPASWHTSLGVPLDVLAGLPPCGASPDGMLAWPSDSPFAPPKSTSSPHSGLYHLGIPMEGVVLECLEIKNVCPFREGRPSLNSGQPSYVLSDKGPPSSCPPSHMPQLQWQMLCTGTCSALLCVESATLGMACFRIARDDAYLADMLHLLAAFTAMRGAFPKQPGQLFGSGPHSTRHAAFLARTRHLADTAPLLDFIAAPVRPRTEANARPFIT
jgi:hypothetical protein